MKPPLFKRIITGIFSRKMALRLLFTVVILATLFMIFHRVENWRGKRAWEAYRKSAEARGVQLWLRDLVTPSIPSEENFASIPFFKDRFGTPEEVKAAEALLPGSMAQGVSRPSIGNSQEGKETDLVQWRDFLVKTKAIDSPGDNPARDIVSALDKSPGLQQIRGAASRPKSKYPTDVEKGFATRLPHLTAIQSATTYLTLDAEARMTLGDNAGAFEDVKLMFRVADSLRDEPYLISLLVRVSTLQRLVGTIHLGLRRGAWNPEQCAAFEQKLAVQDLVPGLRFAMSSERAGMTTELERLANNAGYFDNSVWETMGVSPAVSFTYPRGWFYLNMVKGNEIQDTIAAAYAPADGVPSDCLPRSAIPDIEQEIAKLTGVNRYRYLFIHLLFPALSSVEKNVLFVQATIAQARVALALEQEKAVSGQYPESAASNALFAIQKDPCNAQPLRYRRTDSGYELWSVGTDRKDDNGKGNPNETNSKNQPDWVWKLVRK